MQNQGLGSQGDKIYVESATKKTPNTPQLISPICPSWNMLERRPYWVSEVHASNQQCNLRILSEIKPPLKSSQTSPIKNDYF